MANHARKGKIARLPLRIREELNQRLLDNQSAKKIKSWINALPETQVVLAEFQGVPIDDRNISDWRHGGHQDWLSQRTEVQKSPTNAGWLRSFIWELTTNQQQWFIEELARMMFIIEAKRTNPGINKKTLNKLELSLYELKRRLGLRSIRE